ncbi:P-loop containing nucleoside triphosphate hydrolase protein [Mycena metata]|uniref:P-loop containing nucleoside triphosphate hydrolase protein n=1 Tax=Mycena metata TaxID=1033252 RepID=A0AAD7MKR2_9AGAR|nr:P-loop containing nucleoside triphosphate hydrolase protein [Mycena metata]
MIQHATALLIWVQTCLVTAYAEKKFPVDYIPSIYGGWVERVVVEGESLSVSIFDSAGKSDYDRLRPLAYPQTDVFLVCFGVNSYPSFDNVKAKWFPEAHHHCPDVPCVVVATQIDLRDEFEAIEKTKSASPTSEKRGFPPITTAQGERLARELKAAKYVECSAKTQQGVDNAFYQACLVAITPPTVKKRHKCIIV